jgi:hypothetical protein
VLVQFFAFDWEILNSRNITVVDGYLIRDGSVTAPWRLTLRRWSVLYGRGGDFLHASFVAAVARLKTTLPSGHYQALRRLLGRQSAASTPPAAPAARGLDAYLAGPYPATIEAAREAALAALTELHDTARGIGAGTAVFFVPPIFEVHPLQAQRFIDRFGLSGSLDPGKPPRLLTEACSRSGWSCLDLAPAFQERAASGDLLYLSRDSHWNAAGHRLAARVLADWIIEQGLLVGCA